MESTVKRFLKQFPSVVITGPRQSGKSTLLKHLFAKTHKYLSFDDLEIRERAISDPKLFLENAGEYIILDEIQYVPQILSYIKMLIDEKRDVKGRFIFTGSQQFTLIQNLGDSLAGRIGILELLPFSVEEKQRANKKKKLKTTKDQYMDACLTGSYPEPVIDPSVNSQDWYSSYLQTYLERDVRTVYNVGNLRDFHHFLYLLASRCAQTLNMSSLSAATGVSVNTIKRWISILEAGRIIFLLPPYYSNLGKRMIKSPKVYFLDIGLVCHLLSIGDESAILNGPIAGALFENFVIQETIKQLIFQGKRPEIFYLRSKDGLEVDLLFQKEGKLHPIEIKLNKTPRLSMARPIHRFSELFSKLPLGRGKLLSLQEKSGVLSKQVDIQNLAEYLEWLKE